MSRPSHDWTLDDLDMAYLDGHSAGLAGRPLQPPPDAILAPAWEAGWEDGTEQRRRREVQANTPFVPDPFPPLLSVRIQNRSARPPLGKPDFGLRMQALAHSIRQVRDDARTPQPGLLLSVRISNSTAHPPLSTKDFGLRIQRLELEPRDSRACRARTELLTPAPRPAMNEEKAP